LGLHKKFFKNSDIPDIRAVSPKRCRISMESRISKNMFAYVES